MAAEIIPFHQRPIKWSASALLDEVATDIPACLKVWYIHQCVGNQTGSIKEKAHNLLRHSGAFYSKLYGEWIQQCEQLTDGYHFQKEIGDAAKAAHRKPHLLRREPETSASLHASTALHHMNPHLGEIWWDIKFGDEPRVVRAILKHFEAELLRLA